jgi:hypothetical protein
MKIVEAAKTGVGDVVEPVGLGVRMQVSYGMG